MSGETGTFKMYVGTSGGLTVSDDSGFGDVVTNVTSIKFFAGMTQVLDDGGGEAGINPLPYGVRYELATNTATTGSSQTVPFDTVIYDPYHLTTPHASEITIAATGIYVPAANIAFTAYPTAGQSAQGFMQLNGSDIADDEIVVDAGDTTAGTGVFLKLAPGLNYYSAGDRLKCGVRANTGNTISGDVITNFTILRLG